MQGLAEQKSTLTPEEYFEMEQISEGKNEYWHGEIFDMSGASFHHNIIAVNISTALHTVLRDSKCFVFSGDMKVQVDEARHYTYPDISVVCGDIEFVKGRDDTILNPKVIIEVLSEATRDYDRGSKFTAYRNIASLKDYIVIDQYARHVEYFQKIECDKWVLNEFKQPEDILEIQSIHVSLSLNTIYHRVKFENPS